MTVSHDEEHFRHLYARSADPWAFQTSSYEQEKYQRTMAALGERRFRSGFEPGCSIGVLTRMLATSCDALLAADIVEEPLQSARTLCSDLPWVRFERLRIPAEWPAGRFDLIVLSEVLYFLTPSDIAAVAARVLARNVSTTLIQPGSLFRLASDHLSPPFLFPARIVLPANQAFVRNVADRRGLRHRGRPA